MMTNSASPILTLTLYARARARPISTVIRKRQLSFIGHCLRMPNDELVNIYALYQPKPSAAHKWGAPRRNYIDQISGQLFSPNPRSDKMLRNLAETVRIVVTWFSKYSCLKIHLIVLQLVTCTFHLANDQDHWHLVLLAFVSAYILLNTNTRWVEYCRLTTNILVCTKQKVFWLDFYKISLSLLYGCQICGHIRHQLFLVNIRCIHVIGNRLEKNQIKTQCVTEGNK